MSISAKEEYKRELGIGLFHSFALFGAGYYGDFYYRLIDALGMQISAVFDSGDEREVYGQIITMKPTLSNIYGFLKNESPCILVSSEKYESEIVDMLKGYGLVENVDFMEFSTLYENTCRMIKNFKDRNRIPGVTMPIKAGEY